MRNAFSLVELSIVLVILGLITGGVLLGQNLIRAAELKTIATDKDRFVQAIDIFQEQYYGLPGDLPHATDLWGTVIAGGSCATTSTGNGTQTCNGNGDGRIDGALAANQYGEAFTFWQHLANAELVDGVFTGKNGGGGPNLHAVVGTNIPKGGLSTSGWTAWYLGNFANSANFSLNYGNTLNFGGSSSTYVSSVPILTPEELWNIDTKIDDGKPGQGQLIAIYWATCALATANTQTTVDYNLSNEEEACAFYWRNAF